VVAVLVVAVPAVVVSPVTGAVVRRNQLALPIVVPRIVSRARTLGLVGPPSSSLRETTRGRSAIPRDDVPRGGGLSRALAAAGRGARPTGAGGTGRSGARRRILRDPATSATPRATVRPSTIPAR
jgi:hypothetical protein